MPELAEVEFFRKRWSLGHGAKVLTLRLHEDKKVFRDGQLALLKKSLIGAQMVDSETAAKQMLFRFKGGGLPKNSLGWLGIHLGMTGELRTEPLPYTPTKHDHCVLYKPPANSSSMIRACLAAFGLRLATNHPPGGHVLPHRYYRKLSQSRKCALSCTVEVALRSRRSC